MKKLALLFVLAFIVGFVTVPAGAGIMATNAPEGADVKKLKAFYTSAVQGDGTINWVFCSQATRVVKPDGSARESYKCELTEWIAPPNTPPGMGPDLGPLVYPDKAQKYDDDTGFGYFSDFIFLTTDPPELCWAEYWREVLTPSGQVNMSANYPAPDGCVVH